MAGVNTTVSVNDNMSAAFANMTLAINTCLNAFMGIQQVTSSGFDQTAIENARNAISDVSTAAQQVIDNINEAERQQQNYNNAATQGTVAMDSLVKKAMGLVGAYASWRAVDKVLELSDEMSNTTVRINLMNDGLQSTEEVMGKIYQAAQASRGSYTGMAALVAKLGNNARDAFSSTNEIVDFAEIVQKQFTIAGASTTEASNAMLQLTQALGSGVLRGDELNSIFEQAPNLIQTIADYMGVSIGEIRELAADGAITADIVKNAMFSAADEINERFEAMPTTWAQVGQMMKNQALVAFQPVLSMIGKITAMDAFKTVVSGITQAFAVMASVAVPIIETMVSGAAWIVDNWSVVAPVIEGVVTILGLYIAALTVYNTVQAISNGIKTVSAIAAVAHGTATAAEAAATVGMTTAQMSFNAALYACPITWIIGAIIIFIAAIYAIVAAYNKATDSTVSATGIIVGCISAAVGVVVATVWNAIYGLFSFVVGIGVEIYNLIATFANFFANVFNDPVGAIINLFSGLFDFILGVVQSAAQLIDAVLGSDLSSAVEGFRNTVAETTADLIGEQTVVMKKVSQEEVLASIGGERWAYSDALDWGFAKGEAVENMISDFFSGAQGLNLDEIASGIGDLGDYSAATADNTGKVADSLEVTEDNLAWIKDIAEREIIDRTVFRDIRIDMGGVQNVVNNNADLDAVGQYLADTIAEQMAISAEGA